VVTREEALKLAEAAWDKAKDRNPRATAIGYHWDAVADLILDVEAKTAMRCKEIADDGTGHGLRIAREIRAEFPDPKEGPK
jgi:hypothetical protein